MDIIKVENAFGAPVYHAAVVLSTMNEARTIAASGAPHGTVVVADVQKAGRGRTAGRVWTDEAGKSLLCTTILRFADLASMPSALTLRVGLAACRAVEDSAPALRGCVLVKWPNDLMVVNDLMGYGRKLCGILCESDGRTVLAGVGINVAQTHFPTALAGKATSIATAIAAEGGVHGVPDRFAILSRLLVRLAEALSPAEDAVWRQELEERLFRRGERVRFMTGAADSGSCVEGTLTGVDTAGQLLLMSDGETEPRAFSAGELLVYDA
jgi:BirA family transcriptional regulator, biotin operon repressor / biotin---[acetyl-CoA-carboxylase] ligase